MFFFHLQDQLVRLFEDCATNLCRWTTEAEGVSRKRCSTGSSSVTTLVGGSLIGWEAARMWRIWPGCIPALCLQTNLFVTNNHEILTLSSRLFKIQHRLGMLCTVCKLELFEPGCITFKVKQKRLCVYEMADDEPATFALKSPVYSKF